MNSHPSRRSELLWDLLRNMNAVREIFLLGWKAVAVTVAVCLGFMVGDLLGLPVWLQTFFLLPAALLFSRFSGEGLPPMRNLVGFFVLLSTLVFSVQFGMQFVPENYFLVFVVAIGFLFEQISGWCKRRFGQNETGGAAAGLKSEGIDESKPELETGSR